MGLCVFALRKLGFTNVVGIDSDRSQVDAARSRQLPVELVPIPQTLEWLQQRRGTFDFAYAIDVLEHIPKAHIVDVIRAIAESLKPGATFACRVPNCNSIVGVRQRYIDWTHETSFSPESLDFILYNRGFAEVVISETHNPPPPGSGWIRSGRVARLLSLDSETTVFCRVYGWGKNIATFVKPARRLQAIVCGGPRQNVLRTAAAWSSTEGVLDREGAVRDGRYADHAIMLNRKSPREPS